MQLVKTTRDNLLRLLQPVGSIVGNNLIVPILANILIKKEGQTLSFLSTDLEIQTTTNADIGTGEDSAATTVAAQKLLNILKELPDSSEVSLSLVDKIRPDSSEASSTLVDKMLSIQSGKSRFLLQTLNAIDFPVVAKASGYGDDIVLSQKSLKALLGMVHFAMAKQDVHHSLNGMLLITEGNILLAVATDKHRLAWSQIEIGLTDNPEIKPEHTRSEVIIPRKTILELQRLLADSDEPVSINISAAQIKFSFSGTELISKLVENKFPDYTRVIPTNYKNRFVIQREIFQRALQRAAVVTDKPKAIRCVIEADSLKINTINSAQEEATEEIEIAYNGDAMEIGFNVTYLLDVLGNQKSENVTVALGDANSPALITVPDNPDFRYVVMPLHL